MRSFERDVLEQIHFTPCKSRKHLLVESWIHKTFSCRIQNPTLRNTQSRSWNLESRKTDLLESGIHWGGILNPVPGILSSHYGLKSTTITDFLKGGDTLGSYYRDQPGFPTNCWWTGYFSTNLCYRYPVDADCTTKDPHQESSATQYGREVRTNIWELICKKNLKNCYLPQKRIINK